MKIKTIVLLFGVMFLISGCSVTYNLEIAENTFNESFTINANIDNVYPTKDDLYNAYLEEYPVFIDQEFMYYDHYNRNEDYDYFDKSFQETTNGYLFNYKYSYDLDNIKGARSIQSSFDAVGIGYYEDEDSYYISLNNPIIFNNNNNLTALNINLIFPENINVINNNADIVNGSTYTWQITPNNLKDIKISYRFIDEVDDSQMDDANQPESPNEGETSQNNEQVSQVSEWVNSNKTVVYIGVLVILLCVIIIFSVLKSKKH